MRQKFLLCLAGALLATISFVSCNDDDGDWPPMKWKSDVRYSKNHVVEVPDSGGTYSITCKNYGFWIYSVTETSNLNHTTLYQANADSGTVYQFYWSTARVDDPSQRLVVTVQPNPMGIERVLDVKVSAGDVFDRFYFRQLPPTE